MSQRAPAPAEPRWLVFVHQLPAHPSNARVKTWRRLQQIGAVSVKNAVHVLPNTTQAAEDFEWLRTEVLALGGQATIFGASSISGVEEKQIIRQFRKMTAGEYGRLNKDIKALSVKLKKGFRPADEDRVALRALRHRLSDAQQNDFFSAPGRQEAEAALDELDAKSGRPSTPRSASATVDVANCDRRQFQHRTWVTRPRPGVDRFASAWLIRKFIDAHPTFVFAESPAKYPEGVPFDMYQSGGFKHEGDRCTFEVLQQRFAINDRAVRTLADIVHDLDLKDDRFKHPHRATIGALVEGLRSSIGDDGKLLEQGIAMFEALYQSCHPPKGKAGAKDIC